MAFTFLEGVDDEVFLSFVVLLVITLATLLYYFRTSGHIVYNFLNQFLIRTAAEEEIQQTDQQQAQQPPQEPRNGTIEENQVLQENGVNVESPDFSEPNIRNDAQHFSAPGSSGDQEGPSGDTMSDNGPELGNRIGGREEGQGSNSSSMIALRLKHHETERNFSVNSNITVGELKRLCFPAEVGQGRRVRLIYSGRLLHDDTASMSFYGVTNLSVVHAQISEMAEPEQSYHGGEVEVELDLSRLFIPLLTVILCVCWYGLISYRQLFNATSTFILMIVTAAYGFMVYAMMG